MVAKTAKAKTAAPIQETLDAVDAQVIEQGTDVVTQAAGTDIAEYQPHEAEIVRVEKKFAKVVFECSTTKGLEEAKEARVEIRAVRYALDKTKKTAIVPYQQAVKDAQARVNQVKAFGDELIERVLGVETPIDEAIKAQEKIVADEKARVAELERVRIEGIQIKLAQFRNVASAYAIRSAEDIATVLESLKACVILPDFYGEFEAEATIARDNAIDQVEALHKAAIERELAATQLAAQKQELEELRARQKIADDKAQKEREDRAEEDRLRLKQQQDALDKQRKELADQQEEQRLKQKKLNDEQERKDTQHRLDMEELARLRARAAEPAPTLAVAPAVAAVVAEPVAVVVTAPAAAIAPTQQDSAPLTASSITAAEIVEIVAMSFDLSFDDAAALLRATQF